MSAHICQSIALIVTVLCSTSIYAENLTSSNQQEIIPLKGSQGYILIHTDVEGIAPSMVLARLDSRKRAIASKEIHFNKEREGLRLIAAKAGNYQITKVNTPYFDLPFILDTSDDTRWSFTVEKGHVNYIGQLFIERERRKKSVDIDLLNRLAKDLPNISQQYSELLEQYPLRQAIGYPDNFLREHRKHSQGAEESEKND